MLTAYDLTSPGICSVDVGNITIYAGRCRGGGASGILGTGRHRSILCDSLLLHVKAQILELKQHVFSVFVLKTCHATSEKEEKLD